MIHNYRAGFNLFQQAAPIQLPWAVIYTSFTEKQTRSWQLFDGLCRLYQPVGRRACPRPGEVHFGKPLPCPIPSLSLLAAAFYCMLMII
jgi:hypothetical protein